MQIQKRVMDRMVIDCERAANTIAHFICQKVKEERKDGVVFGLSGGVDSSTVAFLATRVIDSGKVHALYLPDQDSESKFWNYCQKVAQSLAIVLKKIPTTEEMERQGVTSQPHFKLPILCHFLIDLLCGFLEKIIYPLFSRDRHSLLPWKEEILRKIGLHGGSTKE